MYIGVAWVCQTHECILWYKKISWLDMHSDVARTSGKQLILKTTPLTPMPVFYFGCDVNRFCLLINDGGHLTDRRSSPKAHFINPRNTVSYFYHRRMWSQNCRLSISHLKHREKCQGRVVLNWGVVIYNGSWTFSVHVARTGHIADVHSAQWSMCTVNRVDVHGLPIRCSPSTVHRGDVHRVYFLMFTVHHVWCAPFNLLMFTVPSALSPIFTVLWGDV